MIQKAILFDLDGTLVDTAPDLAAATDFALIHVGRPAIGLAAVRQLVGDGARALIQRGFEVSGGMPSPEIFEAAFTAFLDYYSGHLADTSRPFPGAVSCLARLAEQGYAMGVCTNKPEDLSRSLLGQLGLSGFFGAVVGGDTLTVRKPDPKHITQTLERLGGGFGSAVMVGDSMNDIAAARAAGIPSVAVSFGYTRIPAAELGADVLVDHFDELASALSSLGI